MSTDDTTLSLGTPSMTPLDSEEAERRWQALASMSRRQALMERRVERIESSVADSRIESERQHRDVLAALAALRDDLEVAAARLDRAAQRDAGMADALATGQHRAVSERPRGSRWWAIGVAAGTLLAGVAAGAAQQCQPPPRPPSAAPQAPQASGE